MTRGRTREALYVTCNRRPCFQRAAELTRELARIGIHLRVKALPAAAEFQYVSARGARFDIADTGYYADYVDPADFLLPIATASGIKTAQSSNLAYFTTPAVTRMLDSARPLIGNARTSAFERIESSLRTVEDPYIAYATETPPSSPIEPSALRDRKSPVYGLDLGALCIKTQ